MPKVAQTDLVAFGREVKRARSLKGWTLDQLAGQLSPVSGKSFLSNVEKGKRAIGPLTVGKLIKALDLPDIWIDRFLDADVSPEDEETRTDREADRLLGMVEKDPTAPPTAEPLLLLLAEEWAGKGFTDPSTAYTALRGALQAAADLRAQGTLPSNASDQLQAILRRVADLNDQGQMEEADAALKDASDRNAAEADALFDAHLKQDRLRNRPEAAAQRLVARLKASAPPGGLFWATLDMLVEWQARGERMGNPFDLAVALELAKSNHTRAKRSQLGLALLGLGACHLALGKRHSGGGHLTRAAACYTTATKEFPRKKQPENWAVTQNNLGNALQALGERDGDSTRLHAAIDAYTAALTVRKPDAAPTDWATTQNNLGVALSELSKREDSSARLHAAIDAYTAAQTVHTSEAAPMDWAMTQNNLGITLQALGEREGDSTRLRAAIDAFTAALMVYTLEAAPMDWAGTQNNLGLARRWLGAVARDAAQFSASLVAFQACNTVRTWTHAPFLWATTQWNLADLALARHALSPDPGLPGLAQGHLDAARAIFAEAENTHQLAECDRLQAQIDAA